MEGREAKEGGDVCILMADLYCYMAETNTTFEKKYLTIFFFKKQCGMLDWILGQKRKDISGKTVESKKIKQISKYNKKETDT